MGYYVYILTNFTNKVLYVGVTNDLQRRVQEHREKVADSFTKRYNVWKLAYYEEGDDVIAALEREKQLKAGSRARKLELVREANPTWRDLFYEL
jgi:putative endonuclease